ncbi:MAG: cysteine desulfurase, partial [Desulfobacterales bacterium]
TALFFSAPEPDRVIFTANATDGLNMALLGMLKEKDHVVTTMLEHNSVLRPLTHLQQERGVTLSFLPFDDRGIVAVDKLAPLLEAKKTALVVVNHASNVLGTVQPVEKIGKICAAHGVPLLIDASQSAGLVPVSMKAIGASAIAFTGHKSLYAPSGIGGLVIHPELDIQPVRFGGTGTVSKDLSHPQDFPERLEAGTHNLMGIIGLSLALDAFLEDQGNLHKWHEKEMHLATRLYNALSQLPRVQLYGGDMTLPHVALFSMAVDGMAAGDVGTVLDGDFDIAVRTGLHCAPLVHKLLGTINTGATRFSFGRYNTEDDVNAVIHAMERITHSLN